MTDEAALLYATTHVPPPFLAAAYRTPHSQRSGVSFHVEVLGHSQVDGLVWQK